MIKANPQLSYGGVSLLILEFVKRFRFYNSAEYKWYSQKLRNEDGLTDDDLKEIREFEKKNA